VSRVGKAPIPIPKGVQVTIGEDSTVQVKGPNGTISKSFDSNMTIAINNNTITVQRNGDSPKVRALHGLTRALLMNMVIGVTQGYSKNLEIVGVGYRAEKRPLGVLFSLGFSHPILFVPPAGIKIEVPRPTAMTVSGIDKELVGEVAAKIRAMKPPEPYKGKGIRYVDEYVRRKAGKTAK
jgi:large subunit ribosomal protein L6